VDASRSDAPLDVGLPRSRVLGPHARHLRPLGAIARNSDIGY
jgi:hypothetical protein